MNEQTDSFTKLMAYFGSGTLLMANIFLVSSLSQSDKIDSFFTVRPDVSKVANVGENFFIDPAMPAPMLSPEEVIAIQLQALQNNGDTDAGIELFFNFSSPANTFYTGSVSRFSDLIKSQVYESLLNFQSYQAERMITDGKEAHQIILITDKAGRQVAYLFILSKQAEGPFVDCWMTDSIMRLDMQENQVTI